MKYLSYFLMTIGTIGAACAVAKSDPTLKGWESTWQVQTAWFLISLVIMLAGIFLKRFANKQKSSSSQSQDESVTNLVNYVQSLVHDVTILKTNLMDMDLESIYKRLDETLSEPLQSFIDHRTILIDRYGMGTYGIIMTPFSQGERYLNRAWSASVDGYTDETVSYIQKALPFFQETLTLLEQNTRKE